MPPKITIEVFEDISEELVALRNQKGYSSFRKWLENPDAYYTPVTVAVAREKGLPVGWSGVGTTRGRERYPLIGVFVDDSQRGKGLGEKLVTEAARAYLQETKDEWGDQQPIILYDRASWPKLEKILEAVGVNPFATEDVVNKGSSA